MSEKKKTIIAVLFLCALVVLIFILSRREYTLEGNVLSIKTPQAVATFEKSDPLKRQVYLVVGQGLPENVYFHTQIPVIPMGTVEELNKKYGDFRKCGSDGSAIAQDQVVQLQLISTDSGVVKVLKTLFTKSKERKDFLVTIDGSSLKERSLEIRSNNARSILAQPHKDVLVERIDITEVVK